jgi:hypothetical protein
MITRKFRVEYEIVTDEKGFDRRAGRYSDRSYGQEAYGDLNYYYAPPGATVTEIFPQVKVGTIKRSSYGVLYIWNGEEWKILKSVPASSSPHVIVEYPTIYEPED